MDNVGKTIYSQGESYPTEFHDKNGESNDDMEQDKRLHNTTDTKYNGHEQEHLNRSRQLRNNSRCLKSTSSHQVPSIIDDIEEVIYSQGEPYQAELYDRSWESEDDIEQE